MIAIIWILIIGYFDFDFDFSFSFLLLFCGFALVWWPPVIGWFFVCLFVCFLFLKELLMFLFLFLQDYSNLTMIS